MLCQLVAKALDMQEHIGPRAGLFMRFQVAKNIPVLCNQLCIKFKPLSWSACEFQSNGVPVPEERCAHSNANGVAVPFQTA